MNEIVNKFLLAKDKFTAEMHLRQLGFTFSSCESFTKNKEIIKKYIMKQEIHDVYQNELDMSWLNLTVSGEIMRGKAFNIAKRPKYDGYQRGLASMVCERFDNKSCGSGIKNEKMSDKKLAEELR